ncbi:hypothetical protein ABIB27_000994 [Arthrobacter sp. UYEF21]
MKVPGQEEVLPGAVLGPVADIQDHGGVETVEFLGLDQLGGEGGRPSMPVT